MKPDLDALVVRARAAHVEAVRLEQLAHEITVQANATCARHQMLSLSPTVEARVHAERGPLTTARAIDPGCREMYDDLTDWHEALPPERQSNRYRARHAPAWRLDRAVGAADSRGSSPAAAEHDGLGTRGGAGPGRNVVDRDRADQAGGGAGTWTAGRERDTQSHPLIE